MGDLLGPNVEDPSRPLTSGAALGAGPGPEALGIKSLTDRDFEALRQRGVYPLLAWSASRKAGPDAMAWVRYIRRGLM